MDTTSDQTTVSPSKESESSSKPVPPASPKDLGILPVPKHLRYDNDAPPNFSLALNVAFAFASTFTAANLYYCQPLLRVLNLAFEPRPISIPTLVQAGYAFGLLFISPLGDLLRRRQLLLTLVGLSTSLTIGLSITRNLAVFEFLSFFVATFSITPQILTPLAADLAPPNKRASAIAIVLSGLLFGILGARILAGVIAQFASWRVVYYFAIGVQGVVLCGVYWFLPDYPSRNHGLTYWSILGTMAKFAVTEPILVQAALTIIGVNASFSNLWITLTFLLGGEPYHYSTLVIGLFGLVGMAGVASSPLMGRLIDRLVPWHATLLSILMLLLFQSIQVGAAGIHISAVIIGIFGLDVFQQSLQVSLCTAVFSIDATARARLNAVLIFSIFIGQVVGTSAGTRIFLQYGWRASAGFGMACYGFALLALLSRGPHCSRFAWFGYEGGFGNGTKAVDGDKIEEEKKVSRGEGENDKSV